MPLHDLPIHGLYLAGLTVLVPACVGRETPSTESDSRLPTLEHVRRLEPAAGSAWARPTAAAISPDGRIAILDAAEPAVWLFQGGYRAATRIGTLGRGPGEFISPNELAFNATGELGVLDLERRLVVFGDDGIHRRTRTLDGGAPTAILPANNRFVVRLARPGVGGSLVYLELGDGDSGAGDDTVVMLRNGEGLLESSSCQFCPTVLSPDGLPLLASGDTSYAISEVTRAGAVRRAWSRSGVPSIPLSGRERDSAAARWDAAYSALRARGGPSLPIPATSRFKRRFLPHGLAFDDTGRLWVQRTVADGAPATFDLFGPDGAFLGEVRLDRPGELLALRGAMLVMLHSAEDELPEVRTFRVVEAEESG